MENNENLKFRLKLWIQNAERNADNATTLKNRNMYLDMRNAYQQVLDILV